MKDFTWRPWHMLTARVYSHAVHTQTRSVPNMRVSSLSQRSPRLSFFFLCFFVFPCLFLVILTRSIVRSTVSILSPYFIFVAHRGEGEAQEEEEEIRRTQNTKQQEKATKHTGEEETTSRFTSFRPTAVRHGGKKKKRPVRNNRMTGSANKKTLVASHRGRWGIVRRETPLD